MLTLSINLGRAGHSVPLFCVTGRKSFTRPKALTVRGISWTHRWLDGSTLHKNDRSNDVGASGERQRRFERSPVNTPNTVSVICSLGTMWSQTDDPRDAVSHDCGLVDHCPIEFHPFDVRWGCVEGSAISRHMKREAWRRFENHPLRPAVMGIGNRLNQTLKGTESE